LKLFPCNLNFWKEYAKHARARARVRCASMLYSMQSNVGAQAEALHIDTRQCGCVWVCKCGWVGPWSGTARGRTHRTISKDAYLRPTFQNSGQPGRQLFRILFFCCLIWTGGLPPIQPICKCICPPGAEARAQAQDGQGQKPIGHPTQGVVGGRGHGLAHCQTQMVALA
jgi:hypothetical protein